MEKLVKVSNLKFNYPDGTSLLFDGEEFVVNKGERVVILGPNGSGKSTLLSLLLGIVTGGIAFSHNLSIDNAARETARFGATLPVNGDITAYLNQVADVAITSSTGALEDGVPNRIVCVAYVFPDGIVPNDQTTRLVEDAAGVRVITPGSTCLNDGRPNDERRVQITVQRDSQLAVFYFTRTLNLTGQSVARFERGDS